MTLLPWGNERYSTSSTPLNEGYPDWEGHSNSLSFDYPGALPKVNPMNRITIKCERSLLSLKKTVLGVVQVPLRKFLVGAVSLGLYVVATAFFPVEYLLGDALYAKALPVRLAIFAFAMLGYRCRYFGIWKISESICVVNGFGSVVVKDHETWDGCSNVEIVEFETTSDFSSMVHYWNCRIQKWLQMCIYERTNFNQVYVYIVSAFWHGFYPAYYCAFGLASMMTLDSRMARKKLWPRVKGTWMEKPYIVAGSFMCNMVKTFMLGAFSCYTFQKTMLMWSRVDYFMPVVLLVGGAILALLPKPVEEKKEWGVCFTILFPNSRRSPEWRKRRGF